MYAIQIEHLSKTYKNGVQGLNDFNLTIKKGEIFSLLGQNGAGKSTLIRILITLLKPTSGTVMVLGKDIVRDAAFIRRHIACVAQQTSIDTNLSLADNMMFQASLYKVPKAVARKRMNMLIQTFELTSFLKYPIASYSGGIKRRLDIAMNMMSNPQLLCLDEPTVGMDIQSRIAMWKMVKKVCQEFGTTVLLTTHYLEEADALSDSICIMRDGREAIQGTPSELKQYLQQDNIKIMFDTLDKANSFLSLFKDTFQAYSAYLLHDALLIGIQDHTQDLEKFTSFLLEKKINFRGIECVQPTLEDIFLRMTEEVQ